MLSWAPPFVNQPNPLIAKGAPSQLALLLIVKHHLCGLGVHLRGR